MLRKETEKAKKPHDVYVLPSDVNILERECGWCVAREPTGSVCVLLGDVKTSIEIDDVDEDDSVSCHFVAQRHIRLNNAQWKLLAEVLPSINQMAMLTEDDEENDTAAGVFNIGERMKAEVRNSSPWSLVREKVTNIRYDVSRTGCTAYPHVTLSSMSLRRLVEHSDDIDIKLRYLSTSSEVDEEWNYSWLSKVTQTRDGWEMKDGKEIVIDPVLHGIACARLDFQQKVLCGEVSPIDHDQVERSCAYCCKTKKTKNCFRFSCICKACENKELDHALQSQSCHNCGRALRYSQARQRWTTTVFCAKCSTEQPVPCEECGRVIRHRDYYWNFGICDDCFAKKEAHYCEGCSQIKPGSEFASFGFCKPCAKARNLPRKRSAPLTQEEIDRVKLEKVILLSPSPSP